VWRIGDIRPDPSVGVQMNRNMIFGEAQVHDAAVTLVKLVSSIRAIPNPIDAAAN
jgi:hypothetical protein